MRTPIVAVALFYVAFSLAAAGLETRVVDGLGRPVVGADVAVYYLAENDAGKVMRAEVFRGKSDDEGRVRIVYDESTVPTGERLSAELGKSGYAGYSSSQLETEFVLQRETSQTFAEIAALEPALRADA